MLRVNWLYEKFKTTTRPCIGTWITIPSPVVLDVICAAGPDFVVIDTEHSPTTIETSQMMAITCESRNVSPVLRVSGLAESDIVRSLEVGMHAIQIPNVGSATEVQSFVQAARYAPLGSKGLSPFTRASGYSADNSEKMVRIANQNTLRIVQVEGNRGISNIDEILDVDGVDVCFLGMFDLSNYLGIPGQLDHKELRQLFSTLSKKINNRGIIVGSISNSVEQLNFLIDAGVRYITHSADCHVLSHAYRQVFSLANRR